MNYEDISWSRYIDYLYEWTDTHASAEFKGMSPACYDEWFDNDREIWEMCNDDEGEEE